MLYCHAEGYEFKLNFAELDFFNVSGSVDSVQTLYQMHHLHCSFFTKNDRMSIAIGYKNN